jgi:uncharacterized protein (TIGR04255 family)
VKIPRKINPDNIKDSLVKVVVNPGCPPELAVGRFESHLGQLFEFYGGNTSIQNLNVQEGIKLSSSKRGIYHGALFLDMTKTIKVSVSPEALVFNTLRKYPGWETILPVIKETIGILFSKRIILSVQEIGVHYVSWFDNINILEDLKMSLNIDLAHKGITTNQVRSEYYEDGFKIILNLLNNVTVQEVGLRSQFSMIDIDVVKVIDSVTSIEDTIDNIDKAHFKQKSTFFSLLNSKFLETLKPEY